MEASSPVRALEAEAEAETVVSASNTAEQEGVHPVKELRVVQVPVVVVLHATRPPEV